ncbi:MAG: hypothetical protein ABJG47_20375 [Ekhidna sp.]
MKEGTKLLVIRADANREIGMGHLVRSVSIQKIATKNKIQSKLVLDKLDSHAKSWLSKKNIQYEDLGDSSALKSDVENYSELMLLYDIDHKFSTQKNYELLKEEGIKKNLTTYAFADLARKWNKTNIDYIIYPYIGYEKGLHLNSQRAIYGPEYFILREEIKLLNPVQTIKKSVEKITVSMGGSNPNNTIENALRVILGSHFSGEINILMGPIASIDLRLVDRYIRESSCHVTLHWNVKNFELKLKESDIVITNDGLTKYESLYLGIPTIMITSFEENTLLMHNFSLATGAVSLGQVTEENLHDQSTCLDAVLDSLERRETMSTSGKRIIDGNGTDRLIKMLFR